MRQKFFVTALVLSIAISCKKNKGSDVNPQQGAGTAEELLMDSVYLYSKEIYYWNNLIPSYNQFNPRQYKGADELGSAKNVMEAVRKLQIHDRFSFVTTIEDSKGIQTGESKDYGFFVKAASVDFTAPVDSVYWFVSYVYDQSTAGAAGVKRGWIVNKINGVQVGYNQSGADLLNNTFFGNTLEANFEFIKPDRSEWLVSLSKTGFTANSVLHKSVINAGTKKAGYLVFNQFFGQPSRTELGNAFSFFQTHAIDELILDLRYNRGGSTQTQDTLANLIAPLSADNKRMYTYQFNDQLKNGNFPLLRLKPGFQNVSFAENINSVTYKKAGTLNLTRVFIIVSGSSASASELLINNLKPYMEVKLVGDTTYGKPVGFFPVEISNYALYPVSFRTVNSAGNADYYNGFVPDKTTLDGVNKNWGDLAEPSLSSVLNYISNGTFGRMPEDRTLKLRMTTEHLIKPRQQMIESGKFTGMYREE